MDQNVGAGQKLLELFALRHQLQIKHDAALVGVEIAEQAALFGVRHAARKWAAPPGNVALGRLDLDYISAQGSHHLGAECGRHALSGFEYANTRERQMHRSLDRIKSIVTCGLCQMNALLSGEFAATSRWEVWFDRGRTRNGCPCLQPRFVRTLCRMEKQVCTATLAQSANLGLLK